MYTHLRVLDEHWKPQQQEYTTLPMRTEIRCARPKSCSLWIIGASMNLCSVLDGKAGKASDTEYGIRIIPSYVPLSCDHSHTTSGLVHKHKTPRQS